MRYGQLVMGPAGSGKSTYCTAMVQHCEQIGRTVCVVNLDPAAEEFNYPVLADIRELVQLEDVMEADDIKLGPNGGLVFCMEYLVENLDWLEEQLGQTEDDYILFDCPGQIELYTHLPVMRQLLDTLHGWDFRVAGVFLLDAQFLVESSKFFSGILSALSAMMQLEIPHVNVISKMDLLSKESMKSIERYIDPDAAQLLDELNKSLHPKHRKLHEAIANLIDDYSLVTFLPLNLKEEDSITTLLAIIDNAIQYGEDHEHRQIKDDEDEEEDNIFDGVG